MKLRLTLFFLIISLQITATEGMWLPQLLSGLNENKMQSMGMKISAEDIYSINHSSLKDAIVLYGSGCTGEVISAKGLFSTNYHCAFSQIQSLSSISNNYLNNGFWAKSFDEEIPVPGLTVTFIREIKDVTDIILKGVDDSLVEDVRIALVKERSDSLEKTITGNLKGQVRSFYFGNKYYLFLIEIFKDIRLVGAPPQSIGKYGGEADNWVWPRHTGDFTLFRIYADKNNQPAVYSKENTAYTPKQFLTINISGIKEKDFVLIFGFPGRTNEYLFSEGLEEITKQTYPNRIELRNQRLNIWRAAMENNDTINLQYAAKFATLENSYKKWKGELMGFEKFDVLNKKRNKEEKFLSEIKNDPKLSKHSDIIFQYNNLNLQGRPLNFALDYYTEGFNTIELLTASNRFRSFIASCRDTSLSDTSFFKEVDKIKSDFRNFYKNYNIHIDHKIALAIFILASQNLDKKYFPDEMLKALNKQGDLIKFTNNIFNKSIVADSTDLIKFFTGFKKRDTLTLQRDPAFTLANSFNEIFTGLQEQLSVINKSISVIQRKYLNDLLKHDSTGKIYPDANSTLRVSYGKVESTIPADGIEYNYFTTTQGILDKAKTGETYYKIPSDLKDLFDKKDFGRYSYNDTLPVAFTASAHTTGGNSGTPALNSKGELIGINYDRMWEGVMSDYFYDEKICRNICLDIRYMLFIIEKYGKAERLISEMRIK